MLRILRPALVPSLLALSLLGVLVLPAALAASNDSDDSAEPAPPAAPSSTSSTDSTNQPDALDDIEPAKLKLLRQFIKASNLHQQVMQTFDAALARSRKNNPQLPDAFFDQFRQAYEASVDDLLIPIYDRHFNQDELRKLVAFYQSPVGQKLVKEQPTMFTESQQAGRKLGERLGREIARKLHKQGKM